MPLPARPLALLVEAAAWRAARRSSDSLLGHEFDLDSSGCLDRAEAYAYAQDMRSRFSPRPLGRFEPCARSLGFASASATSSVCVGAFALDKLRLCLAGGLDL